MLRNVKPKVHELDINQMNKLNELNFCVPTILSGDREIKQSDTYFAKNYNCCGGSFELCIDIDYPRIINDKPCGNRVWIQTPYDRWWCSDWKISEFTKDMDDFQQQLKTDLQELRKLGLIS